jgi:DNA processing protein
MNPTRLRNLLDHHRNPGAALAAVRRGRGHAAFREESRVDAETRTAIVRHWERAADPERVATALRARGTAVRVAGSDAYPIRDELPDRPSVLLLEGDGRDVLERPRVAIVGTRAATFHGLDDARQIGAHLARHGITVVSGMAIGIDGAAHDGALAAGGGAVGVLATGLDVVYPRRHVTLFDRVRRQGLLVSETGFGVQPAASRFPVRNRIIAGLADVVVVVEATRRGGARITAEQALEYGRPVLALPGSRRNPAAAGCNALIADGAHPLLEPDDVLVAIGLIDAAAAGWNGGGPATPPRGDAAIVLRACSGEPATADQLASRTGLGSDQIAVALSTLARSGHVTRDRGYWWPR